MRKDFVINQLRDCDSLFFRALSPAVCENGACRSLRAMLKIYIKTLCSFLLNKFMPKSKYISDRTEAIFAVFVKERCRIILTRRFCLFQILHSDRKRFVFVSWSERARDT